MGALISEGVYLITDPDKTNRATVVEHNAVRDAGLEVV